MIVILIVVRFIVVYCVGCRCLVKKIVLIRMLISGLM